MAKMLTSAAANKLLKRYNDKVDHLYLMETQRRSYTQIEGKEEAKPDYDFYKTRDEIEDLNRKILVIKHAINEFNVKTVIKNTGLTIDQTLIRMAQLTKVKSVLDIMRSTQEKQYDSIGIRTTGVVGLTIANFNPEDAQRRYDDVCEELSNLQLDLDMVNNTEMITVEGID